MYREKDNMHSLARYIGTKRKFIDPIEFGEIQKFSRLAKQAGESNNKYTVNCIFVQKSRHDYARFNVVS